MINLNVAGFDAAKHGALPLAGDARCGIEALDAALGGWKAGAAWTAQAKTGSRGWQRIVDRVTAAPKRGSRGAVSDAQVLGAVNRAAGSKHIMVCAAGGLPGELHKLWRAADSTAYHVEYGYSCMGYEIAGGLGAKLAAPERDVYVLVGDGSYLMMNSEIATSVALNAKLTIVVLDNRGFGCIQRLQHACGAAPFNNRLADAAPHVDFAMHARSLGAHAVTVQDIAALETALVQARRARVTSVIVIATDPAISTAEGGHWWDVAVNQVPRTPAERRVRLRYLAQRRRQKLGA